MNWLLSIARFVLVLYFFVYGLLHLLVAFVPQTTNYFVFMNLINWSWGDLSNPPQYGLTNVHNFYLDTEKDVRVGIWHYIPFELEYDFEKQSKMSVKEHFERYFKVYDGRPVFLYAHGNDADRGQSDRIKMCRALCKLGYHVFAIDYRGYGDSTGWPSEQGVVNDVIVLHNFIKSYQKQSQVFIWGHSLGTGITCHASKILSEFNSPPAGVVLEAPFKNISQAAKEYIIAPLILNNPWIIRKGDEALEKINLHFNNDKNIVKIKSKILIFHAEDDWFIPQDHSRDLIEECRKNRPKDYPPVKLVELHKDFELGHLKIYSHQEIYPIIKEFVEGK